MTTTGGEVIANRARPKLKQTDPPSDWECLRRRDSFFLTAAIILAGMKPDATPDELIPRAKNLADLLMAAVDAE
jgi:hypothetical protein